MAERRIRTEFDANTASFERGVRRMNQQMRRFQRGTESRLDRIDRRFRRSARAVGQLRNVFVGFVAAAGARQLAASLDRTLSRLDEIAKVSDRLGVGVEALQEFRFAAEQSGVATRTFDVALQRFSRRAAEAAQGTGEAQAALDELGIQLTDSAGRVREVEDLFVEAADALADIEAGADRTRIAFKLFDSEGVAVLNMVDNLRELREEARRLGIVMSEDIVRDAERMRAGLDEAFQVIGAQWDRLILRITRNALDLFDLMPRDIDSQMIAIMDQLVRAREDLRQVEAGEGRFAGLPEAALEGRAQQIRETIAQLEEQAEATRALQRAEERLRDRASRDPSDTDDDDTRTRIPPRTSEDRESFLERELRLLAERTAVLRAQAAAQRALNPELGNYDARLRAAAIAAELLVRAEREGVEITPELEREVRRLALAYAENAEAADNSADAQDRVREASSAAEREFDSFARSMFDAVKNAQTLEGALNQVAAALTRILERFISTKFEENVGGSLFDLVSPLFGFGGGGGASFPQSLSLSGVNTAALTFHRGGVVGQTSVPSRSVPANIFDSAPRLHDGLGPREFPAILERGEIVVPKNVGGARAGANISVGDTVLNVTEPGASPDELRRILAEHRKETVRQIIEMNEKDPTVLHT